MVNSVAVIAILLMSFYIVANKEYLTKIQIIFRCVNSAFLQLYCLKFSFKLANMSRSYDDVPVGSSFYPNTVYYQQLSDDFQRCRTGTIVYSTC